MKLVLFDAGDGRVRPGALRDDRVVDLDGVAPAGVSPQRRMEAIIDGFDTLRGEFQRRLEADAGLAVEGCGCVRRYRVRARSCAALRTTGNTRNARRGR